MARKPGSRAEITGPRLRDAALRLFARDGYAAVSMRQIAAEVGVQATASRTGIDVSGVAATLALEGAP